jgi:spermidine synthase
MFVSLVAPHVFASFAEWRYGLVVSCLLAAWVILDRQPQSFLCRRYAVIAPLLFLVLIAVKELPQLARSAEQELFVSARNFYGVISAVERDAKDPARHVYNFYSGRIVHGVQFVDPQMRHEPTAYFGRTTGVGQTLSKLNKLPDLRVGVVGLGIGTLAAYAQPGQYFRFYELNDDVKTFADKYFSYLRDCRGKCDVVLGDGRLSLEREQPQQFDLLVLDAFSGDAVPTHLLTQEAFEIYRRHLRPGATIAVNISNRYLDLSPVVAGLANRFGYTTSRTLSAADSSKGQFPADWIVLTPATAHDVRQVKTAAGSEGAGEREILWTDDHSNLFEILK